jgi:hypothetical protein
MSALYDDDDDIIKNKRKRKKIKSNPSGPFNFKMTYRGIYCDITIQNITKDEFEVTVNSSQKLNKKLLQSLNRYLEAEGFQDEARNHNLYWYMV